MTTANTIAPRTAAALRGKRVVHVVAPPVITPVAGEAAAVEPPAAPDATKE